MNKENKKRNFNKIMLNLVISSTIESLRIFVTIFAVYVAITYFIPSISGTAYAVLYSYLVVLAVAILKRLVKA